MCHGEASAAFPDSASFSAYAGGIQASVFGDPAAARRIAILPDIYGSNPFYQGLATRLADRGSLVYLIDTFAGLGDLPRATREAAFDRRHKLRDRTFVDQFAGFVAQESISGIVGFCLGGLFVFELARRGTAADLVGFYPFPQGLPNQDALDVPFDYLDGVVKQHTILVGTEDASLGPENLARLGDVAERNPALRLHVFESSGHGFLADLTSDDAVKRDNAERALGLCEAALGIGHDGIDHE